MATEAGSGASTRRLRCVTLQTPIRLAGLADHRRLSAGVSSTSVTTSRPQVRAVLLGHNGGSPRRRSSFLVVRRLSARGVAPWRSAACLRFRPGADVQAPATRSTEVTLKATADVYTSLEQALVTHALPAAAIHTRRQGGSARAGAAVSAGSSCRVRSSSGSTSRRSTRASRSASASARTVSTRGTRPPDSRCAMAVGCTCAAMARALCVIPAFPSSSQPARVEPIAPCRPPATSAQAPRLAPAPLRDSMPAGGRSQNTHVAQLSHERLTQLRDHASVSGMVVNSHGDDHGGSRSSSEAGTPNAPAATSSSEPATHRSTSRRCDAAVTPAERFWQHSWKASMNCSQAVRPRSENERRPTIEHARASSIGPSGRGHVRRV